VPDNKKHHYVPRFYLRRFARDGRSLSLFNFTQNRAIDGANLKTQCYRDYMCGRDGIAEHNLSQMEGCLSELLKRILSNQLLPPPWSVDHESLCILTLLQRARTAYTADAMDESADKMWKKILEKDPRVNAKMLDQVRIAHTDPANFSVKMMLKLYHLIMDLDYRIITACKGTEFVTSDNPVVFYNQLMEFENIGSQTGVACKGLQIFFPLSPTHLLAFFDASVYAYAPRRAVITEVPTPQDMLNINALQVASAQENVYYYSPAANIYKTVELTKNRRRTEMSKLIVLPEKTTPTGSSQIIGTSSTDIKTNLSLSFVKLLKPAKRWRDERMKPGIKHVTVLRKPEMVIEHEKFQAEVDANRYQPTDFVRYLQETLGFSFKWRE
jgi:hypothetical protein